MQTGDLDYWYLKRVALVKRVNTEAFASNIVLNSLKRVGA